MWQRYSTDAVVVTGMTLCYTCVYTQTSTSAVTTMEAVIRSVTIHTEASGVCVTKDTISHMMRELVKVFISFVRDSNCTNLFDKCSVVIL